MQIKEISYGTPQYNMSIELRDKILRKPLGMVFTEEFLKQDKHQYHIAMFDNNKMIGILVLKPIDDNTVKMRQVAIDDQYQGKGLGKKLVEFSEKFARNKGFKQIELHARKTAVPFYLRLNYTIVSDEFTEVGIPHYKMSKKI